MRVCTLASGSKGNLTYIESASAKILVDCGLCMTEVVKRLSKINVLPNEIDAILITHEHSDHIKGVEVFARKYGAKVFAHADEWVALNGKIKVNEKNVVAFYDNDFYIKDLLVTPFRLSHDSFMCVGYTFCSGQNKVSIATDTGYLPQAALSTMFGSDLIIIESNHDEDMLINNYEYPAHLKSRILSKKGHLSNVACASAIYELIMGGTKQFVLAHLSENNNTPHVAYNTVCGYLLNKGVVEGEHMFIDIALQDRVGTLFTLSE